jgi:hypothetical protein
MLTLALLLQLAVSDSQGADDLSRSARAAQTRFERIRRSNLPLEPAIGASGHCDLRVGRYCYWYDPSDTVVVPEPRRIADARIALLAALTNAAARLPSDGWVAGQLIRYELEAGRIDAAERAASECRAERWWCAALSGLALHVGQRYADAESAYAIALDSMPREQRCEWIELRTVVGGAWGDLLGAGDCAQREGAAERLWALSQPLWSNPGNDLRTEHFARHTMALILRDAANAHAMAFGSDSKELLLRYGWPAWYTRLESSPGAYPSIRVSGHDREPAFAFFPEVRSPDRTSFLTADAWRLKDPMAITRYAPRHLSTIVSLPHQLARFVRGDSMLVVAAFDITDSLLRRDSLAVALALLDERDGGIRVSRERSGRVITGVFSRDTAIASLEALGLTSRRAARARYSLAPPHCQPQWCLSDLLLLDPARSDATEDPALVVRAALPGSTLGTGSPVEVFWEISSDSVGGSATIGLTVSPVRVALARRAAAALRLVRPAAPVRLRWESVLRPGRQGQRVTLRLPRLARGRYRIDLAVERSGRPRLSSVREIDVE